MYNERQTKNATNRDTPGKTSDGGIASVVVGSTSGTMVTSGDGGIASGVVGATVSAMLTSKCKQIMNPHAMQEVVHAKHGINCEMSLSRNGNTPTRHGAPELLP